MSRSEIVLIAMAALVLVLFILNWLVGWRRNSTDAGRGVETWQGWDDGHGGGI